MTINQIIMYIMAFGVALGGMDRILGNRLGFGEKFEAGFRMLGPIALSMAGIICLAPLLSSLLGTGIRPVCRVLHMDPGIFGSILSIDMGGYPLALDLAQDPALGRYSAVIVSSTFGCTLVFSIPVGLGFLKEQDRPLFTRGILLGLCAMPLGLLAGGMTMGLSLGKILWNSLPVLLISAALMAGVLWAPQKMIPGFLGFAKGIKALATLGLTLAAITHLTGIPLLPGSPPLQEAMQTVSSIGIVMLGSMPLAELIQRVMEKPFRQLGRVTGLNGACTTALILGLVSATPALAMIPQMNKRGQVVASAFLVSGVCVFGSHFAFTNGADPQMVPSMLTAKLVGGLAGGIFAFLTTKNMADKADQP